MSRTPVLKRKWYFTGHTALFVWESWNGEDDKEEGGRKRKKEEDLWRDPYYGERKEGWEE